jgi:ribosomal protein L31E
MAEEKKTKIEKKETKKLDDVKDTPENKAAIAKDEGKKVESKPAVEKDAPKGVPPAQKASAKADKVGKKKGEPKVELEREYVVPLKKGVLNVPHYRRAKKAVRVLKEFMVRHMGVRDRDLKKVKVDINLNNEIWFRGIKKPMNKIKVKAKKVDGIVYVELAEIPEVVGFKLAREKKKSEAAEKANVKTPKSSKDDSGEPNAKDKKKTEEEKAEEKEDVKAGAEADAKIEKSAAKNVQHSTKGSHAKKSMPVRKSLKK